MRLVSQINTMFAYFATIVNMSIQSIFGASQRLDRPLRRQSVRILTKLCSHISQKDIPLTTVVPQIVAQAIPHVISLILCFHIGFTFTKSKLIDHI